VPGVQPHAPAHPAAAATCGPSVQRNVCHSAAQNVEAKLRLADAYAPSTPSAARDTHLLSRASAANARMAAATTTASAAPATLLPLPSCTGVLLTARMWRPWCVARSCRVRVRDGSRLRQVALGMLHHTGDVGVLQDHALAMKWFAASRARVVSACLITSAFRYESAIASASTATAVPARLMIMVLAAAAAAAAADMSLLPRRNTPTRADAAAGEVVAGVTSGCRQGARDVREGECAPALRVYAPGNIERRACSTLASLSPAASLGRHLSPRTGTCCSWPPCTPPPRAPRGMASPLTYSRRMLLFCRICCLIHYERTRSR
jgi:TPR repeat protein